MARTVSLLIDALLLPKCFPLSSHVMYIHIQALETEPQCWFNRESTRASLIMLSTIASPPSRFGVSKCCTGMAMMYLHRWSDNPVATRAWVGWLKLWRWSLVSVLYLPVIKTVLIYGPSCQVERGNIPTVFFWKLAPGVSCCLKVTFCIVMS